MYQYLYNPKKFQRFTSLFGLALFVSACHQSCGGHFEVGEPGAGGTAEKVSVPSGLVVGAVVNATGRPALRSFERRRYADQIASSILAANPELSGNIDSYEYLSRRVGAPLGTLLKGYRAEGDFSSGALQSLKSAELRRRYLMMVSILPQEQSFPLKPDIEPVIGKLNREVKDYYDQNRQTILLTAVRVQVFDTVTGSKISDNLVRSDDGDRMLATESRSRQYVGNSVLATITNAVSNALSNSPEGQYPLPPKRDDVLNHIWTRIAEQVPRQVF